MVEYKTSSISLRVSGYPLAAVSYPKKRPDQRFLTLGAYHLYNSPYRPTSFQARLKSLCMNHLQKPELALLYQDG